MALTWTLKLKDALSSAAGKMASALLRLDRGLAGTRREADALDRSMAKASKGTAKSASSIGKGFSVAKGLAVNAISAIAGKLGEFGAMGLDKLGDVLSGGMEKAGIMTGLAQMLGSAGAAEAAFAKIAAQASAIGANTLEAAARVQQLIASGFSLDGPIGALRALTAGAALKVLNPKANIDGVMTALAQIKAKGKLTMEELNGQLGDHGVDPGMVVEALAKQKGKTADEIRKMITAGAISAEDGIQAVFTSIEQKGGASLEAIAAKGKGTFGNMLNRLMALPGEIGSKLDLSKFFESGIAAIDTIITKLSDPAAVALFDSIFNVMGAGLLESGVSAFESIIDVLTDPRAISFFENMAEVIGSMFEGFGEGFGAVADVMMGMDRGDVDDMSAAFRAFGQAVGGAVAVLVFFGAIAARVYAAGAVIVRGIQSAAAAFWGFVSSVGAAVAGAIALVMTLPATIGAAFTGLVATVNASAIGLGSSIIAGITAGITAGASSVANAITGVAQGAIAAAKDTLGIASPSKVFENIFKQTGAGAESGINKSAPRAAYAAGDMSALAAASGAKVGQSINNSSSDNSRTMTIGTMNVSGGGGDPRATARAVSSELRSMVQAHG